MLLKAEVLALVSAETKGLDKRPGGTFLVACTPSVSQWSPPGVSCLHWYPELSVHSSMAHKWGSISQPPNSFPCMMMNHVKQNEYANLLRAGLTSMGS